MTKTTYYAGTAMAIAAAALGFAAARLTAPIPATQQSEAAAEAPGDALAISAEGIRSSGIRVEAVRQGELDAAIPASATVEASPDAEAVLTARAPGTIARIFKRIGDSVRAGETVALVESRDASAMAGDRSAAAARLALARRQFARERELLAQGVSPRADMETAEAGLAVAQAELRRAEAAAGAARLWRDGRSIAVVSPIAGRITAASADLGRFVAAETDLFHVADPRRLQVIASLPAAEAGEVRAGNRVELTTNDGRTIEGRVRSATGVVDPETRAATVVVAPTAGGSTLLPGQMVQARIFASKGAASGALMVPQAAVQTLGDKPVVFVRTRTGFRAQPVQLGRRSAGFVAIVGGLAAGTAIATENAFLIKAELEKGAAE